MSIDDALVGLQGIERLEKIFEQYDAKLEEFKKTQEKIISLDKRKKSWDKEKADHKREYWGIAAWTTFFTGKFNRDDYNKAVSKLSYGNVEGSSFNLEYSNVVNLANGTANDIKKLEDMYIDSLLITDGGKNVFKDEFNVSEELKKFGQGKAMIIEIHNHFSFIGSYREFECVTCKKRYDVGSLIGGRVIGLINSPKLKYWGSTDYVAGVPVMRSQNTKSK